MIREVRAAVGPDFPLMLDCSSRCEVEAAIRIGKVLDDADYFCFDRPRPDDDPNGGMQVAGGIDTPTSAGVISPRDAAQVMAAQSADHIRTSVQCGSGFTDVLKSARCAEAFGAFSHLDGIGMCDGFAHLHLAAACRNSPFLEWTSHETASPFIRNRLEVHEGYLQVPDLPGLGMDLDLDAVMESTSELIGGLSRTAIRLRKSHADSGREMLRDEGRTHDAPGALHGSRKYGTRAAGDIGSVHPCPGTGCRGAGGIQLYRGWDRSRPTAW